VYPVENVFFGSRITVTGLLTGQDIISALSDKVLGEELLIPASCLRDNAFLDDVTVSDMQNALHVQIKVVSSNGYALFESLVGAHT
jgi:NifB/MoaA-like Fe-S oxidoreductase